MEINDLKYDPYIIKLVQNSRPKSIYNIDGKDYNVEVIKPINKGVLVSKEAVSRFVALALVGAVFLGADSATVKIMDNYEEPVFEPVTYIIPSEVSGFDEIKIIVRADGSSDFILSDGSLSPLYNGVHSEELLIKASSVGMLYRDDYGIKK